MCGYANVSVEGGAREPTSERSDAGCTSQREALGRIRTIAAAENTSHSGVRIATGKFETEGRKAANATKATQRNASDLRLRNRDIVLDADYPKQI